MAVIYLGLCLSSPWIYQGLEADTLRAFRWFWPTLLLLPFPKGCNAICGQTLRASGDTLAVMNIFVAGQWRFKVPMTALLVLVMDVPVTWVVALFLAEELLTFPMFHLRLWKGTWKRARVTED